MAIISLIEGFSTPRLVLAAALGFMLALLLYRAYFDPLRSIPGPLTCRITSLWTYYHSYIGDECTRINQLHEKYGPVIRIAPNEVCIADGAALAPIYSEKGGFLKAPCYTNFDIEGHRTIFSALDPAHRAVRSKAVLPMFSMANVRAANAAIEDCVDRFIVRLKQEVRESRDMRKDTDEPMPLNILNLARSLALDAMSSYLFGQSFGRVNEGSNKMSASSFVDALVAVGRFFFLPNWLFLALEMSRQRLWPDQEEIESAKTVNDFVQGFVRTTRKDDATYQGRLSKAGISVDEVKIQCEDLIFAGTDSTGMNLSTICWYLAREPEVYRRLRREIAEADAKGPNHDPQSLRLLDAVIREGLRIAMANPTRLPRVVPPRGFDFTTKDGQHFQIRAGTLVGLQIFTLHFNPDVYPDPYAFKPDRWLNDPTPEMQRDWIPFGLGPRQCIARNLATKELFLAVRAIARDGVLEGAKAVGEKIEILEWFNSRVKGEAIKLVWE